MGQAETPESQRNLIRETKIMARCVLCGLERKRARGRKSLIYLQGKAWSVSLVQQLQSPSHPQPQSHEPVPLAIACTISLLSAASMAVMVDFK